MTTKYHETQTLKALADGCTVGEAALRVHRAKGTVMKDLERLRSTFDARNTTHLIAKVIRRGLI